MSTVYELWVDDVKMSTHPSADHQVKVAESDYADRHWYIIKVRTVTTYDLYRVREGK